MHDGLHTLPSSGVPQPPPGAPAELREHGHREAQNSRRRRGGHPAADGLLLTRMAEDQPQSDPGRPLPEERQQSLRSRQQGDQLFTDPKWRLRQALALPRRRSQSERQAEIQQDQRHQQPNKSGRPVCLTAWTHIQRSDRH